MLNYLQMSDLWQYQAQMPDCKEKELLHTVLFEYSQYTEVGSPQEVKNMADWMNLSVNDIRRKFNAIVKGLQEEVEYIRETERRNAERKRGRPRKEE